MMTFNNGTPAATSDVSYQWNTTGCYSNIHYHSGTPRCFAHGQTSQKITGDDLTAEDAGTITCTATIDNIAYSSGPLTLRISGIL